MTTYPASAAAAAPPTQRAMQASRLWGGLLLVAVVALAYSPVWHAGLVWDDDAHLTAPALQSAHGLWRIWTEIGATQQYYPLLHSFFWLQHRLWGGAPLGYHLVNVILHTANALLLWRILHRLAVPGAWLAAFLFALHPVHVESVAWVSEQKNTLSGLFYLGAAGSYLRYQSSRENGRGAARWYFWGLALFAGALASKSVTATLPAALLVVTWWRRRHLRWRDDLRPLLPWLALGVMEGLVTAWVEMSFVGASGAAFALSFWQRCGLAGRAVWFYLGKLCWPEPLIFIYPRWQLESPLAWAAGLAAIALALACWTLRRRSRAPLAALLVFAGTLFPALGFFNAYPFLYSYVADHFQYLASIAPIALASAAIVTFIRNRAVHFAVAIAAGAAFGLLTWRQTQTYRTTETLYRATLAQNPQCWMAANNLGRELMRDRRRLAESIPLFEAALRSKPDYAEAETNLGLALTQSGRADAALPHLERAVALNPNSYQAHNDLGIALATRREFVRATAEFARAAALNPRLANIEENWAKALLLAGAREEAAAHFAAAARLRGASANAP